MATRAKQLRMTLAEFLRWDDGTATRYELVDGRVVAMAPPNDAYGTTTANLAGALANALRPPCRVAAEVGILRPNRDERRVELWRREGDHWRVEDRIGEASVRLESCDASIPLAAIYANVALAGADQPQTS